jgi:hypothetical protein
MRQEAWAALVGLAVVVVLSILLWYWLETIFVSFILGLAAGLLTSFLWLIIQYELLLPSFNVLPAEDKPQPTEPARWVHVVVKNRARGLLGGGSAKNCEGIVTLADGRTFTTK